MRHPSTARRDGDLSRLTSSSSSSSPSSSNISNNDDTNNDNGNFYPSRLSSHNTGGLGGGSLDCGGGNDIDTGVDCGRTKTTTTTAIAECCHNAGHVSANNGGAAECGGDDCVAAGSVAGAAHSFRSGYLPAVIDPHDWPAASLSSRKRKERQDSGSSSGGGARTDRKLIRSNSEEFIASGGNGGIVEQRPDQHIRRVCSHEEFKRPLRLSRHCRHGAANNRNNNNADDGNVAGVVDVAAAAAAAGDKWTNNEVQDILKETIAAGRQRRSRNEISPARSRVFDYSHKIRVSPSRCDMSGHRAAGSKHGGNGGGAAGGGGGSSDVDADGENERRRSSERFCRARAPTGRKQSAKRPSKYLAARLRGGRDESVYKYDLHVSKGERRGSASGAVVGGGIKKRSDDEENNDPTTEAQQQHDVNDNNLQSSQQQHRSTPSQPTNVAPSAAAHSPISRRKTTNETDDNAAAAIPLPWNMTYHTDDPTPVVCPRFTESTHAQQTHFDQHGPADERAAHHHHHAHRRSSSPSSSSSSATDLTYATSATPSAGAWKSLGHFMKSENLKTREAMQNAKLPIGAAAAYQTPDEKLHHIQKRLSALKRRVAGFDESFEREHGYRPSQADRQDDRSMKSTLAEMHRLRRDKQLLKSDPMAALGLRTVAAGAEAAARLTRIQDTMQEIEMRLTEKRTAAQRPFVLDDLTADQLMHEKLAVQKALIYFESLHGRPSTREERDAARGLYGRYRTLKRLVNRTVTLQVSGGELPTIMEHEAMQFVSSVVAVATDADDSPCAGVGIARAIAAATAAAAPMTATRAASSATAGGADAQLEWPAAPGSPLSEMSTTDSTDTTSSSVHENVHQLSLDELWHHLDVAREQRMEMRRTIREFETVFEKQNGRRMLKSDRPMIEQTYAVYKQRKAKLRLLEALVKKHMAK